jgi:hypothetical protein
MRKNAAMVEFSSTSLHRAFVAVTTKTPVERAFGAAGPGNAGDHPNIDAVIRFDGLGAHSKIQRVSDLYGLCADYFGEIDEALARLNALVCSTPRNTQLFAIGWITPILDRPFFERAAVHEGLEGYAVHLDDSRSGHFSVTGITA